MNFIFTSGGQSTASPPVERLNASGGRHTGVHVVTLNAEILPKVQNCLMTAYALKALQRALRKANQQIARERTFKDHVSGYE